VEEENLEAMADKLEKLIKNTQKSKAILGDAYQAAINNYTIDSVGGILYKSLSTANKNTPVFAGIIPYSLRKSDVSLIPLNQLICPNCKCKKGIVADLTSDDHIVIHISSRVVLGRIPNIKCKVSLIIAEPKCIQQRYYKILSLLRFKFHKIFTNYSHLSSKYSNVISLPLAYSWVDKSITIGNKRDKLTSLIASEKQKRPGHKLRHEIINTLPKESFEVLGRGYKPFVNKADGLTPYMYSIVIENCKEVDYFTEKIVDCFMCGTIPIYWGANNISDYFDSGGVLSFETIDELRSILKKISTQDFTLRSDAINNNRKIAQDICKVDDKIISILKNE
jgi:hypothetical protein